jgi:2-dehydro-3-deoxyphosphooctonate aldolase (KDO 8-P synthase)
MRIIAGPCQHENLSMSFKIAEHCAEVCSKLGIEYIFKASYDKANRTNVDGTRGMGMRYTMDCLSVIKSMVGCDTLTDVHDYVQAKRISREFNDSVDILQIPAFLCRQTDLIKAACDTGKIINIKKGQFLAPWDVEGILSKTEDAREVWITERGTSFGYNNLVVDFNGIQYMLDNYDVPIVFDATHSCQKPGGNGNSSGGNRDYVPGLSRAASALGVSNFFLEVHPDPDNAPSDGPNMVYLKDFENVVSDIVSAHHSRY